MRASSLRKCREFRRVYVDPDIPYEERKSMSELRKLKMEAKRMNKERTEEEKKDFYWKVRGLEIVKEQLDNQESQT